MHVVMILPIELAICVKKFKLAIKREKQGLGC
jgi:hypothetical protein